MGGGVVAQAWGSTGQSEEPPAQSLCQTAVAGSRPRRSALPGSFKGTSLHANGVAGNGSDSEVFFNTLLSQLVLREITLLTWGLRVAFPQTTVAALPHGPSGNVRIHEVRGNYPIPRHRASSTSSHLTKALSSLMISIDRVFIDFPFAEKKFRPGGLCLRPLLHREAGFIRNAIYKLFIPRGGSGLKITGHSMEMSAPPRISFLLEISEHGRPVLSTPQNIFVPLSQCHPRFLFQGIPLGAASNVGMKRWSSQSRVVDEPERPERREMDTLELT
ncbi:uncharacterized protein CIMG_10941 [Coccidioides immitis RS]|uniref:Uncharacterized protein n=1 Tax=Coccidioides immitis (strain RS) TaxID=246410 RepID=A0A0D8JSA0_COCIM|nr:uncharacterized protein CIMG_10941 [Coccidioides immitis RS]KJF60019.1 hypothetical protein CIMG_10941 [Coccidioides immitis RS]